MLGYSRSSLCLYWSISIHFKYSSWPGSALDVFFCVDFETLNRIFLIVTKPTNLESILAASSN